MMRSEVYCQRRKCDDTTSSEAQCTSHLTILTRLQQEHCHHGIRWTEVPEHIPWLHLLEHHILLKCHNQGGILFQVVHFLQPVIKMTMQCKVLLIEG